METLMTKSTLVVDHLVLRSATEEAEIDHLRQALIQGHYLLDLKDNQPALHRLAPSRLPVTVLDEWTSDWEKHPAANQLTRQPPR